MSAFNRANALLQTKLVGGTEGTAFSDVTTTGWPRTLDINLITKIEINSGWIVDGIIVTYSVGDAVLKRVAHGTDLPKPRHTVEIKQSEIILAITGRAGYQSYYKRDMINSISFVILDVKSSATRVVGPFGNENGSNNGEVFHVSSPIAFGGFAKDNKDALGLSGLSFFKAPDAA